MKITLGAEAKVAIFAGVALVAYIAFRGFSGAAKDVSKAAINTASGAVAGVAEGVGEAVGIPETNMSQCEIDIANKDYWAASLSCPAPRFLKFCATGK